MSAAELKAMTNVFHAHWSGAELRLNGGIGARHEAPGRYMFEASFKASSVVVNVEIDAPWRDEETAGEVEICLMHPDFNCPDDDDANMNCKLVKRIVRAPRWTPLVAAMKDGSLEVQLWCAPLAPPDGKKAVGETVLADVGFSVLALEPS
jgi:hypothetical protein